MMIYAIIPYGFFSYLYSMGDKDVHKYIGLILLYRSFKDFTREQLSDYRD
jgi:hypothetical protein